MKLIPEWRRAYKLFSVQAMALATAILGAWLALPDDLQAQLPHWIPKLAAMAALGLGIVGRLISQMEPDDPEATAPGLPPNGH